MVNSVIAFNRVIAFERRHSKFNEPVRAIVSSRQSLANKDCPSRQDSLMARLDRLGTALEAALDSLVAAGIFLPEGRGLNRGFSFKHALLRDAAYESLLLARRREWHERTARIVETSRTWRQTSSRCRPIISERPV